MMLSYDNYSNYFKGKVNVGMFVTMNATKEFYDKIYKEEFEAFAREFQILNGKADVYPCYNTVQAKDYSKFSMAGFNEEEKKIHEKCYSVDLENAYNLGVQLSQLTGV